MTNACNSIRQQFDRLGMVLSGLCAVHCLASIVVLSAFGFGGELLLEPAIHKWGLAIALVVAAVAIGWGALQHRKVGPFVVAITGLTFMVAALAAPHGFHESVLTMIGVVLVSLGHVFNLRCSRAAAGQG